MKRGLREIEKYLRAKRPLAECNEDPQATERFRNGLGSMRCLHLLLIGIGHEDGIDAGDLSKLARERLPYAVAPCSQPTQSRMQNAPPGRRKLARIARTVAALLCAPVRLMKFPAQSDLVLRPVSDEETPGQHADADREKERAGDSFGDQTRRCGH